MVALYTKILALSTKILKLVPKYAKIIEINPVLRQKYLNFDQNHKILRELTQMSKIFVVTTEQILVTAVSNLVKVANQGHSSIKDEIQWTGNKISYKLKGWVRCISNVLLKQSYQLRF